MTLVSNILGTQAKWHGRATSCAVALSILLGAAQGKAQPADVTMRTAARELATQGAEAYDKHDYALAYDRLTRAFALFPVPSISIMQARCLVQLGRLVEALDRYEETRRMPLPDDAPEAFREATRDAAAEGEPLRARIPRLLVQARRGATAAKDVTIHLDGRVLPAALIEVDFSLDPGDHDVTVEAPGSPSVTRRVSILEKERVVLEIALDAGAAPSPPAVAAGEVPKSSSASNSRTWWGVAALGGGAVGLVGMAITGKIALDKKSHLDQICDPGCPAGSQSDIDTFRSFRTMSYVAAGVSAAMTGLGGYLVLTKPVAHTGATVGLFPGGVSVRGRF